MSRSTFISFGDVASVASNEDSAVLSQSRENRRVAISVSLTSPVYTGSDSLLAQLSKKLLKKDVTTRKKCLQDICDLMVRSNSAENGSKVVLEFLPNFCYAYERLWSDNDRSVREGTHLLLHQVIKAISLSDDKQALGPFMSVLIGPWRLSCVDSCPEVASAAKGAWELAIPGIKKRQKALFYLSPCLIRFIQRVLHSLNLDVLPDAPGSSTVTPEEIQDRIERIHLSAICCIEELFSELPESDILNLVFKGTSVPPTLAGTHLEAGTVVFLKEVLSDASLWSKLSFAPYAQAILRLFITMSGKIKSACAAEQTAADSDGSAPLRTPNAVFSACNLDLSVIFPKLIKITRSYMEGQKIPSLCALALNALVTATSTFSGCWEHFPLLPPSPGAATDRLPTGKKGFLEILGRWLSESPDIALEYLLPLIASFPVEHVAVSGPCAGGSEQAPSWLVGERLVEILNHFQASRKLNMKAGVIMVSVAEALTYMLLKRSTGVCPPSEFARRATLCSTVLSEVIECALLDAEIANQAAAASQAQRASLERVLIQLHRSAVASQNHADLTEVGKVCEVPWTVGFWERLAAKISNDLVTKYLRGEPHGALSRTVHCLRGVCTAVTPAADESLKVDNQCTGVYTIVNAIYATIFLRLKDLNSIALEPLERDSELKRAARLLCLLQQEMLSGDATAQTQTFVCFCSESISGEGKASYIDASMLHAVITAGDAVLLRDMCLIIASLARQQHVQQQCDARKFVLGVLQRCVRQGSVMGACLALQCGLCNDIPSTNANAAVSNDISEGALEALRDLINHCFPAAQDVAVSTTSFDQESSDMAQALAVIIIVSAAYASATGSPLPRLETLAGHATERSHCDDDVYLSALLTMALQRNMSLSSHNAGEAQSAMNQTPCISGFVDEVHRMLQQTQPGTEDHANCTVVNSRLFGDSVIRRLRNLSDRAGMEPIKCTSIYTNYLAAISKTRQQLNVIVPVAVHSWAEVVRLTRLLSPWTVNMLIQRCMLLAYQAPDSHSLHTASASAFARCMQNFLKLSPSAGDERQDLMRDMAEWALSGAATAFRFEVLADLVSYDERWLNAFFDAQDCPTACKFLADFQLISASPLSIDVRAVQVLQVKILESIRCNHWNAALWRYSVSQVIVPGIMKGNSGGVIGGPVMNSALAPHIRPAISVLLQCMLAPADALKNDLSIKPSRRALVIDNPLRGDVLPPGTAVYYVEQQPVEASPSVFKLHLSHATLEKAHHSEEIPYYTLLVAGREVQTEAHRVFLKPTVHGVESEAEELLGCPTTSNAASEADASEVGRSESDKPTELLEQIENWLLSVCQQLCVQSYPAAASPSFAVDWKRSGLLDIVCEGLQRLGAFADYALLPDFSRANAVFGAYRHAVIQLLDLAFGFDDETASALNFIAARILHALCESNKGRGLGLWLPRVLRALSRQMRRPGYADGTSTAVWARIREKVAKGRKFDFKHTAANQGSTEAVSNEKEFVQTCFERHCYFVQSVGFLLASLHASVASGGGRWHDMVAESSSSALAECLAPISPWRALLDVCKQLFLIPLLGTATAVADVLISPALTYVCVACLRGYWGSQCTPTTDKTRAAYGDELMPALWEIQAYQLCIRVFSQRVLWDAQAGKSLNTACLTAQQHLSAWIGACRGDSSTAKIASPCSSTESFIEIQPQLLVLRHEAAMAVHYGLVHIVATRGVTASNALLQDALRDRFTRHCLHDIALSYSVHSLPLKGEEALPQTLELPNSVCSGLALVTCEQYPSTEDTPLNESYLKLAVVAAKALDAWYGSGAFDALASDLATQDTAPAEEEEEEVYVHGYEQFTEKERAEKQQRKEQAAFHREEEYFQLVAGPVLARHILAVSQQLSLDLTQGKPHSVPCAHSAVLSFLLVLQKVDHTALNRQESRGFTVRARCGSYIREVEVFQQIASLLLLLTEDALQALEKASGANVALPGLPKALDSTLLWCMPGVSQDWDEGCREQPKQDETDSAVIFHEMSGKHLEHLALLALFRMTVVLPAGTRTWFNNDLSRIQKARFSKFVECIVRPASLERELLLIRDAQAAGRWDTDKLEVRGFKGNGGEVAATFLYEDAKVEMRIKIPSQYPLRNVEVECSTKLGVPEAKWRRWSFQIVQLLSMQDGTIIDGLLLWKKNMENEFEGVEPCPICYSTLHHKSMSLPSMTCPTCSNKFHPLCLNTWFKQSGKHKCVICQQPFFQG